MEQIKITRINGEPIVGRIELSEMLLKLNEIVDWINKYCPWAQCGKCGKIIKQPNVYRDEFPICEECWYKKGGRNELSIISG